MLNNAHVTTLANLFNIKFEVPTYQRGYDWDVSNINDFLDDIENLIETSLFSGISIQPEHFFGSLIVCPSTNTSGQTLLLSEVIDGQQRLATFMLIYRAIYDILDSRYGTLNQKDQKLAKKTMEDIEENCIMQFVGNNPQSQYLQTLTLSKVNKSFFELLMSASSISNATGRCGNSRHVGSIKKNDPLLIGNASNIKLWRAYLLIKKRLISFLNDIFTNSKYANNLQNKNINTPVELLFQSTRNYFQNGCKFVFIVADSSISGIRLFSVLNDRGKSLTEVQLLQARILGLLNTYPNIQNQVERSWDMLLKADESVCVDLLRYFYTYRLNTKPGKRTLFDDYESNIFKIQKITTPLSLENVQQIQATMNDLVTNYDFYNSFRDCRWPYPTSTGNVAHINMLMEYYYDHLFSPLSHKLCVPLLMSAFQKFTQAEYVSTARLIEKAYVRSILSGGPANKLEVLYMDCVKAINSNQGYNFIETLIKNKINADYPVSQCIPKVVDTLEYAASNKVKREQLFHLLNILNEYYSAKFVQLGNNLQTIPKIANVQMKPVMDIEHIYPQDALTQDPLLEPDKNRLPNLVWLPSGVNRAMKNSVYSAKVSTYTQNKTPLMEESVLKIAPNGLWTKQEYDNRRQKLIDDLKDVYKF